MRLLAQLAGVGATVLVCVSVHKALPAARDKWAGKVMPDAAEEFGSVPVPTKTPVGWHQARHRPLPQPGAREGNNMLQRSAPHSLLALAVGQSWH